MLINIYKTTYMCRNDQMGKVSLNITVDEEVLLRFKKICKDKDMKVSTKINSLMREWADNDGESSR